MLSTSITHLGISVHQHDSTRKDDTAYLVGFGSRYQQWTRKLLRVENSEEERWCMPFELSSEVEDPGPVLSTAFANERELMFEWKMLHYDKMSISLKTLTRNELPSTSSCWVCLARCAVNPLQTLLFVSTGPWRVSAASWPLLYRQGLRLGRWYHPRLNMKHNIHMGCLPFCFVLLICSCVV